MIRLDLITNSDVNYGNLLFLNRANFHLHSSSLMTVTRPWWRKVFSCLSRMAQKVTLAFMVGHQHLTIYQNHNTTFQNNLGITGHYGDKFCHEISLWCDAVWHWNWNWFWFLIYKYTTSHHHIRLRDQNNYSDNEMQALSLYLQQCIWAWSIESHSAPSSNEHCIALRLKSFGIKRNYFEIFETNALRLQSVKISSRIAFFVRPSLCYVF